MMLTEGQMQSFFLRLVMSDHSHQGRKISSQSTNKMMTPSFASMSKVSAESGSV